MPRIAVVAGDGIGPEVMDQAVRVLEVLDGRLELDLSLTRFDLGASRYLDRGVAITDEEFGSLSEDHDAILLGALGDPRVPGNEHARDILLGLRTRLDLYINYRPSRMHAPGLSPLREVPGREIDLHVFRENTEGVYGNLGGRFRPGTDAEIAIQEDVNTRHGVERILRAAFEFARRWERSRVTMVDKANAMPAAGALWRETFEMVSAEYDDLVSEAMYVDAMAMELVRRPERYDVIVTSNLFGDILSDLAAQVTGGLGTAPSANLHPGRHALFEPVHGSAPDIAGRGIANPLGMIACASLLLYHVDRPFAAECLDKAISRSIEHGPRTPDLGGSATTSEVGRWIARALEGMEFLTTTSNETADG